MLGWGGHSPPPHQNNLHPDPRSSRGCPGITAHLHHAARAEKKQIMHGKKILRIKKKFKWYNYDLLKKINLTCKKNIFFKKSTKWYTVKAQSAFFMQKGVFSNIRLIRNFRFFHIFIRKIRKFLVDRPTATAGQAKHKENKLVIIPGRWRWFFCDSQKLNSFSEIS